MNLGKEWNRQHPTHKEAKRQRVKTSMNIVRAIQSIKWNSISLKGESKAT